MAGMEDRRAAVTSSSTVVSGGLGRGGFEPIVDDGEGVSPVDWGCWRAEGEGSSPERATASGELGRSPSSSMMVAVSWRGRKALARPLLVATAMGHGVGGS